MGRFDKFDVFMKILQIIEWEQVVDQIAVSEEQRQRIITIIEKIEGNFVQQPTVREETTLFMEGDRFENITDSTIVSRSIVERSFNKVRDDFDQDTAMALLRVAEEIAKSGNKEAAELFAGFNEELQKPEPKKSVLRSLWDGMIVVLPSLAQLADVGLKISKLFTSN